MVKSNYMEFVLTPEITDEIIFAMEDQTGRFVFDSQECRCVPESERAEGSHKSVSDNDDGRYCTIPVWDSISGFRMMDRFGSQLRNPVVREDLRSALAYGQGVFRNFKNILKNHPEVERLWFKFKEREMKIIVLEWYNNLRDFWGLERIGAEPDETDEIISEDFVFRLYGSHDKESLDDLLLLTDSEISTAFKPGLSDAVHDLWIRIRGKDEKNECVLIAESAEGDMAGCSISSPLPSDSLLCAQLTLIAVFPEFRGLGIGKKLLEKTVRHWSDKGYRWLLFTSPVVPQVFLPVMQRTGFIDKGHVSILELF